MPKKPPREVFHSVPDPNGLGWAVKNGGETVSRHRKQETSEAAAVKAGHKAENDGGLGQAILHKRDGTIREERTYGSDPKKSPG
jgi:hypothetical protein